MSHGSLEDEEEIYLTPRRERHPQDDDLAHELDDAEERGLLTGQKSATAASESILDGISRRNIFYIALLILVALLLTISVHPLLALRDTETSAPEFHPGQLLSNGTHDYEKIVLIVSIDGLRFVYHHFDSCTLNVLQCSVLGTWPNTSLIRHLSTRTPCQMDETCISRSFIAP